MSVWKISYHGATVQIALSILRHGEFVMEGDVMVDGTYLAAHHGKFKDQKKAIWTYPTREGADKTTVVASFDNDETQLKILLQLRQRASSYTESETKSGFIIWSTNRRGTLYIEAVHVSVLKSKRTSEIKFRSQTPSIFSPIAGILSQMTNIRFCPVHQENFEFLQTLKIPNSMFNKEFNKCYCSKCWPERRMKFCDVAGERYIIPKGWSRFGLAVNPVFATVNDIWDSWNIAFHGCAASHVIPILKHRTLLIPHDILSDGTELGVNSSADQNQKCFFLSPAIDYSAHPWYARYRKFKDKIAQVVIMFRVSNVQHNHNRHFNISLSFLL